MKVGDLVTMITTLDFKNPTGIVLQLVSKDAHGNKHVGRHRVKVYWIEDNEVAWEPKTWLEILSAS